NVVFPSEPTAVKRLLDESEIQSRVAELGALISADYRQRPLTVLGVLTGSIVLLADVIRRIDLPLRVGVIQASSYRGRATSAGPLTIHTALLPDIAGRDVLLIDDIFDTGHTLAALVDAVAAAGPASVRTAVLLWKDGRREVELEPDYHCFRIPNVFVVGYGLDYNDDYRHLPYIAALDDADLEAE
ncbi:MAG: hypoxanthine phosphoribosyltransferase, partial [Planctomycetaceae bacterium]